MRKQKRKYAKCPSCSTEKHRTEMTACISILEKIEKKKARKFNGRSTAVRKFAGSGFMKPRCYHNYFIFAATVFTE